jgi:hypothetical protein
MNAHEDFSNLGSLTPEERMMQLGCVNPKSERVTPSRFPILLRFLIGVLLIDCLLLASPTLDATSVVALFDRAQNRLVIATDCLVNRTSGYTKRCKIIYVSGCFVAIAGLSEEPVTGFQLREIVRTACRSNASLRDKAETFLRISREPYRRAVMNLQETQRERPSPALGNDRMEAVFAGLQDGHIALFVRGLAADASGNLSVERYESSAPSYKRVGFFLGLNKHIRSYISAHPDWQQQDFAELATQFVQLEIDAHPKLAGPPISEFELDKDGNGRWLARGACDAD